MSTGEPPESSTAIVAKLEIIPAAGTPSLNLHVESVLGGVFFLAYPSWRLRSTWPAIIVHSAQSVFISFLVLGVVLGLA